MLHLAKHGKCEQLKIIESPVMDDCNEYALLSLQDHYSKHMGKVYVANNLNHIGHLKIGRTCKSIQDRERSLNSAGVIGTVKILYWIDTMDCYHTESLCHSLLKEFNLEKEFFNIDFDRAVETLHECTRITNTMYNKLYEIYS
jgi:hypothetical protein